MSIHSPESGFHMDDTPFGLRRGPFGSPEPTFDLFYSDEEAENGNEIEALEAEIKRKSIMGVRPESVSVKADGSTVDDSVEVARLAVSKAYEIAGKP